MKNLLFYTIVFYLISFAINVTGQDCVCTDCPIPILDNTITTSCLEVSGLTNPTLGASGQGVCGISLEFNHTWLTEVQVQLIAPNGSAIDLIQDDPGGSTPNSTWDINYVPCSESAMPDPGYPDEFTSTGYNNGVFTGTYYPGDGCFEDLTGPANGTWKLQIEDFVIIDEGEITSWSITFCDGTGTNCGPPLDCIADAGTDDIFTVQDLCITGPDYIIDPVVSGQAPFPEYEYTFTISNSNGINDYSDIITYSDNVDFSGFDAGLYWVCGLSYLATDEPLLPVPDGVITNDDIQNDIDNSIYCADLSSDCFLVSIAPEIVPLEIDAPDILCVGEMGTITILNYSVYEATLASTFTNFVSGNYSSINVNYPTIEFVPLDNEFIEICITLNNACGSIEECVTIDVIGGEPLNPEILGETETCYGNTYEYTISNLDGIVDYSWNIDPSDDAYIVGSNTESTVTVTLLDDPVQFSASICFEYEDECGIIDEICLDITPNDVFFDNDLTPDSFCGLDGDFNIEFTGNGTGSWVQDSGPGSSVFFNQNDLNTTVTVSESGMYSFTYTTECDNMITVDIEFFPEPQVPIIDGIFEECPGETLMFSASNIETSTIINWSISGDGIIVGPTNSDMVEVVLDDPASTNLATLCLEVENSCGDLVEVCEDIDLISVMIINQTLDNYCSLIFSLDVLVDGTVGSGQWTLVSGPGTATFVDEMSSSTFVEVNQLGDYIFEFSADPCGIPIEVPVTIFSEILIDNIVIECVGEDFIVSFDISGGEGPYSVDGILLSGTSFTSNLLSGDTYSLVVSDNTNCDDVVVAGNSECECITDAGSISPQELIASCNDLEVTVFSNGDDEFDENDGFIFILFTDVVDPLGSIVLENTTGIFSFTPPLIYGIAYYVGYVVGDDLGGSLDYSDPCLDIATGTSIIFVEPFGLDGIEFSEIISCDIIYELTSIQSSSEMGEWSVLSAPAGGSVIFDGTSGISTIATFSEPGTYTIQYLINNGLCIDSQELIIEVTEPSGLSIVNISYECDDNDENYQVSFEIMGGISPFTVNGVMFLEPVFTSQFITTGTTEIFTITDANGCSSVIFISEFECVNDCISFADMNIDDLIEICGDDIAEVLESELSVLEGDDIGVFILHTNSGNVLGTILDQNTTGMFSFIPTLSYDVVYYISYVVGNEIAGDIDLADECLSVAPGQGVIFYEEPSVILESYMEICAFDFTLEAEVVVGDSVLWELLNSPIGSSIQFTNNSQIDPSILVDRVGLYEFTFTLINGSCVSVDTVIVEVLGEHSVLVMDDFATCNTNFEIYSLTVGSPKSWDVNGTSNFSIGNTVLDTTEVTFDTTGIFEIIRNVGIGLCAVSDTFSVEIFEESTFEILDIICDENNATYSISYSIDGDSYPYTINGQIVNLGESIDLIASSGETLVINVVDVNLCEIYSDSIFYSCDCESEPGIMDGNLIEACSDEPIEILPSVGSIVAESDSLIYVLHSSSGLNIIDILAVSSDPEFSFDPAMMSLNTVYYVSAVVYNGGVFDITILEDICTITSIGTPVLWLLESMIELPGELKFCKDEDVEVSFIYFGELPLTVRLRDDFGNDYDLTLTEEGESSFVIDLQESSELIIDWFFGISCQLDIVGELNIEIRELPLVEFTTDNITCNSSANGSTILLDDLISATNSSGSWFDPAGNPVAGLIDFDGLSEGEYEYQFVTSGNQPCQEVSYTIPINVEECDCPMDIFLTFDGLCQGAYIFDLNEYLKSIFNGMGTWSVITKDGNGVLELIGSQLSVDASNVGIYEVIYTFDTVPQDCELEYTFEIEIRENLSSGISSIDQIEICVGDLLDILLFDYLEEYDEGGIWASQNGLPINVLSGVVDLSLAEGGLYTFDYEIPENEFCPASSTEISILIHDPLKLFLSILDPLCFGDNDGSVSATNTNGEPILFDLFNSEQEAISNPDSLFAGEYELRTVDENGCIIVENFTLLDPLELFLDLGEDRIVEEGEVTTITPVLNLEGEDISLYQWFVNQANLNNPTIDTLLISPDGETIIQLIITDDDGCIVEDELLLSVLENETPVVLASIFNPLTSTFGIEAFKEIDIINSFEVFDRWGSLVFQEKNYSPSDQSKRWDGTFNGSLLTNGVYVYSIKYTNKIGNAVLMFGDVTIVR